MSLRVDANLQTRWFRQDRVSFAPFNDKGVRCHNFITAFVLNILAKLRVIEAKVVKLTKDRKVFYVNKNSLKKWIQGALESSTSLNINAKDYGKVINVLCKKKREALEKAITAPNELPVSVNVSDLLSPSSTSNQESSANVESTNPFFDFLPSPTVSSAPSTPFDPDQDLCVSPIETEGEFNVDKTLGLATQVELLKARLAFLSASPSDLEEIINSLKPEEYAESSDTSTVAPSTPKSPISKPTSPARATLSEPRPQRAKNAQEEEYDFKMQAYIVSQALSRREETPVEPITERKPKHFHKQGIKATPRTYSPLTKEFFSHVEPFRAGYQYARPNQVGFSYQEPKPAATAVNRMQKIGKKMEKQYAQNTDFYKSVEMRAIVNEMVSQSISK